jgi:hypothetical protein
MATIGNAPVFPTESVLPGNLEVTGNATINGTTNSVGALTENSNSVVNVADTGVVTEAMLSSDFIEEGTWTPTFGGTSPSTGQSYSNQTGYYKKVGPLVYVQTRVTMTNKGTMSGGTNALIRGLPFTHGTGTGRSGNFSFNSWNNINNSTYSIRSYIDTNNVYLTKNATGSTVNLTDLTNTSSVDISGLYYTDE